MTPLLLLCSHCCSPIAMLLLLLSHSCSSHHTCHCNIIADALAALPFAAFITSHHHILIAALPLPCYPPPLPYSSSSLFLPLLALLLPLLSFLVPSFVQ